MNARTWVPAMLALGTAAALLAAAAARPEVAVIAQTGGVANGAALAGEVRSDKDGPMEGVLVRAHRAGSNKTVTVVTTRRARTRFRASGSSLAATTSRSARSRSVLPDAASVEVASATPGAPRPDAEAGQRPRAGAPAHRSRVAGQLSAGRGDEVDGVPRLQPVPHACCAPSMSTYNAEQLAWVMKRMVYSAGSSPMTFQLPNEHRRRTGAARSGASRLPASVSQAKAVAAINLSHGMWNYELKTLPRPKGKETQVVYTTWDLPVTARPHDTRMGKDGLIYYNHFNDNAIGRLDPNTGETKEWRWPYRAKEGSFAPTGARTTDGARRERPLLHRQPGAGWPGRLRSVHGEVPLRESSGRRRDDGRLGVTCRRVRLARRRGRRLPDQPGDVRVHDGQGTRGRSTPTTSPPIRRTTCTARRAAATTSGRWTRRRCSGLLRHSGAPRSEGGRGTGMRRGITDGQNRLWWGGYDGNFVGCSIRGSRRASRSRSTRCPRLVLPLRRAL